MGEKSEKFSKSDFSNAFESEQVDINMSYPNHLFLRLDDGNVVGKRRLGSSLAGGIVGQHDFYLDTQHTLSEKDKTRFRVA